VTRRAGRAGGGERRAPRRSAGRATEAPSRRAADKGAPVWARLPTNGLRGALVQSTLTKPKPQRFTARWQRSVVPEGPRPRRRAGCRASDRGLASLESSFVQNSPHLSLSLSAGPAPAPPPRPRVFVRSSLEVQAVGVIFVQKSCGQRGVPARGSRRHHKPFCTRLALRRGGLGGRSGAEGGRGGALAPGCGGVYRGSVQ
jgi:hypothetical protein